MSAILVLLGVISWVGAFAALLMDRGGRGEGVPAAVLFVGGIVALGLAAIVTKLGYIVDWLKANSTEATPDDGLHAEARARAERFVANNPDES